MGQGDMLRKEVENKREWGRYISELEVRAIVERWLAQSGSNRNRLEAKRSGIFDLQMSRDALQHVFDWMKGNRALPTQDDSERAPLTERLSQEGHAWVTFDSDVANANPMLPFLHASHEVVATAITELSALPPPDWISRVGRVAMPAWAIEERPQTAEDGIALAIYRVRLHGLENQTTMLPIALSVSSGEVIDGLAERLMGTLSASHDVGSGGTIDEDDVRLVGMYSFEEARQRTRRIEQEAREQQDSRVSIQTATLRRSFGARIRRSQERALTSRNERIRRLHEGRARNLQGELDEKLDKLEHAPEPTASFAPISLAVFVPEPA